MGKSSGSYKCLPLKSALECMYVATQITEESLKKITAPTLIIQSTHDGLVKPASGKFAFNKLKSTNKNLLWINEPHYQLHSGKYQKLIYSLISQFMLGWV